ncbi:MAG: hypothetical protein ACREXU_09710 [Gammaproteobacteria bacterium]
MNVLSSIGFFDGAVLGAMPTDDKQMLTLAREIQAYLAKHPNAADML